MLDPDLIRVDVLRVKRKIYLSLPENRKKDFLVASKLSELSYLQKIIPKDMADHMFDEYYKELKYQLINIFISLISGISISIFLWCWNKIFPHIALKYIWVLGLIIGFIVACKHAYFIYLDWQKIKPFREDYQNLQNRIGKLWEEMIKEMK